MFQAVPTETNHGHWLVHFLRIVRRDRLEWAADEPVIFVQTDADAGRIDDHATRTAMETDGWHPDSAIVMPSTHAARRSLARGLAVNGPDVVVVSDSPRKPSQNSNPAFAETRGQSLV